MKDNNGKEVILTVCIITFNHKEFIEAAIDSVLCQETDYTFKILIADDASTDGTTDILLKYREGHPKFIELVINEVNMGAAKTWCGLIGSAISKYIMYFEGDDFWISKDKIQKQIAFLESHPDYAATTSDTRLLTNRGYLPHSYCAAKESWLGLSFKSALTYRDIQMRIFPHTSTWCMRNPNPLPEGFERFYVGDVPLFLLLADKGMIKFSDEVMTVYRKHTSNITARILSEGKIKSIFLLLDLYYDMELVLGRYDDPIDDDIKAFLFSTTIDSKTSMRQLGTLMIKFSEVSSLSRPGKYLLAISLFTGRFLHKRFVNGFRNYLKIIIR